MIKTTMLKLIGAAALVSAPALCQSPLSFSIGGGVTVPGRGSGSRFNTGYNLNAGIGVHAHYLGVMAEFGFNHMNVSNGSLNAIGVPGGSARIYSATLNPMVHLLPGHAMDVYLIGGGGFYRRTVEFTQPGTAIATGFDPFFGIFYPVQIQTTDVISSSVQNRGGINGGVGLAWKLGGDTRSTFFAEARYHHIYTSPRRTNWLPVTFGFRW